MPHGRQRRALQEDSSHTEGWGDSCRDRESNRHAAWGAWAECYGRRKTGLFECNRKDEKKYQVTSTLKELQPKLTSTFLQTHKSFIVNVKNIRHIDYPNNIVTFNNNFKAYLISNRGKRELKEYVKNH